MVAIKPYFFLLQNRLKRKQIKKHYILNIRKYQTFNRFKIQIYIKTLPLIFPARVPE